MTTTADEAKRLYERSFIAGPMVRASSHVFRAACVSSGADVVFSPGLVDLKIIQSERKTENGHTVLYCASNGHESAIFRTCAEEKPRLVLQLISNSSPDAVLAMKKIEDLASGIDLNCGCPEHFAVHRGCGSSLPVESAADIVKTLVRETSLPISVKFRVEPDIEKSLQFAKAVESAGASMITVHGRVKDQQHKGPVDYAKMKQIFESVNILTTGNGGITSLVEAEQMREQTGCNSVMICTAAMKNPSVFSGEPVSQTQAFADAVAIGKLHNIPFRECKWSLQQIVSGTKASAKLLAESFNPVDSWEAATELVIKHC